MFLNFTDTTTTRSIPIIAMDVAEYFAKKAILIAQGKTEEQAECVIDYLNFVGYTWSDIEHLIRGDNNFVNAICYYGRNGAIVFSIIAIIIVMVALRVCWLVAKKLTTI